MTSPTITSIATRVPQRRYQQEDVVEQYLLRTQQKDMKQSRERAIRKIFQQTGVNTRYTVADESFYSMPRTIEARNDRYMETAVPLGIRTLEALFADSDYTPQDVDSFSVVSCTGYGVPGLDLQLAGAMQMRTDLQRTCILGMGCYGAIPGLRNAYSTVQSGEKQVALVLALELCSLHLQFDAAAESVVSAALFSDGAAAALVTNDLSRPVLEDATNTRPAPQFLNFKTQCDYNSLDEMSFSLTDTGFRMYLSSYVPQILASNVVSFVEDLLDDCHLTPEDISFWAIHPGSTKIVDFVQEQLNLSSEAVASSHSILADYGNMSSATILFVLEHIQVQQNPPPDSYGVVMAFGPGLTMEGVLVQW